MSKLVEHAKRELELAGLFAKDSDYDGMLGEAVLRLVECHAKEGHSGMSHSMALSIFNRVANFKALGPITSDPREWMEVGTGAWQNLRQSSLFSVDAGKTHYDIDDPEQKNWPRRHNQEQPSSPEGGGE